MPDLVGFLRMMDMNFLFFKLIFRNSERKYERSKATRWLWWYLYGIGYLYLILSCLDLHAVVHQASKLWIEEAVCLLWLSVCISAWRTEQARRRGSVCVGGKFIVEMLLNIEMFN